MLQLVLTRSLYEKFPNFGEGPLTQARAQLVNRRALAEHGRRLDLGQHLIVSRGEDKNRGRERPSTLADAFEALLGALFMDGGYEAAQEFILRQFRGVFGDLDVLPNLENPKGELQEALQARSPESPRYVILSVSGPDHERVFECAVLHRKAELGRGCGKSKKEAESQAALNALAALKQRSEKESPANTPLTQESAAPDPE